MNKTKEDIEQRLEELGLNTYHFAKDSIRAFQRINGLKVDGIAGPETQAKLWPTAEGIPNRDEVTKIIRPNQWPHQQSCREFYGLINSNQTRLRLPWPMKLAWDKRISIYNFSCHEKVKEPLEQIFEQVGKAYDTETRRELGLNLFGGCLNVRKMRGGNSWSMHSWGIAVDIDPARNQLEWKQQQARLSKPDCDEFWRIVEATGAISLGRTRDFDWMHFQFARI